MNTVRYSSFSRCVLMTLSVSIGTFSFAYNSYLLNGPLSALKIWLGIDTSVSEGVLVAAFNLGGFMGCLTGFHLVKAVSRRSLVMVIDSLIIIGTIGLLVDQYYVFCLCRLIAGMGGGLNTLGIPLFLKEVLPTEAYGILSGQNLVILSLGTIVQSFMVLGFPKVKDGDISVDLMYWPIYLIPPVAMSLTRQILFIFYFRHESPYYSLAKGDIKKTQKFMEYIYQPQYREHQYQTIELALELREQNTKINGKRLRLGVLTNIIYALSGITPIITYSTIIFKQVTEESVARFLTIGMSVIKFIFYSTGALVTQKYGRRGPLLIGTALLSLVLLSTGYSSYVNESYQEGSAKDFATIYCIIAIYLYFVVFFNSFGAIIPIYTPEILSGTSLTIALSAQWTTNITVTFLFPVIKEQGIYYTFFGFGGMMLMGVIYFYFEFKETRNLTDIQINKLFQTYRQVDVAENSLIPPVQ